MASGFFLLLCFLFSGCHAVTPVGGPKGFVIPVSRDPATKQYVAQLQHSTPLKTVQLVVDLGAAHPWLNCDAYASTTFRQVRCPSPYCAAPALWCSSCEISFPPQPGCIPTCEGTMGNTISDGYLSGGNLSADVLVIRSTDGRSAGPPVTLRQFMFMCSTSQYLPGLASGSQGMLGLGRTALSAPNQLASAFSLKKKFALCLSASSSPGVILVGSDGPYVMYPDVDVSQSLAYTKLLINPVSLVPLHVFGERSAEFFVKLTSIAVNGKPVPVNTTLFDIHKHKGGTKISTVVQYTTLESSIYKALEDAFVREAQALNIKRVGAVAPFNACFSTGNLASTRVGWAVPAIELVFEGARFGWNIAGANSMVSAGKGVMCLGFADGGVNPNTAVVIGGLQLEDNLLQFDLELNRMGFSNTLLYKRTSCANFKLT